MTLFYVDVITYPWPKLGVSIAKFFFSMHRTGSTRNPASFTERDQFNQHWDYGMGNDYIHIQLSDAIVHPCPYINGGSSQRPLKTWRNNYLYINNICDYFSILWTVVHQNQQGKLTGSNPHFCVNKPPPNHHQHHHHHHYHHLYMGQVTKLRLSCYLVLLSVDSKTR